jgi:hypothetical protein
LNGVPSWNVTPGRSFITSVLGSVNSHDSARPGRNSRLENSKCTSRSYIEYSTWWSAPELPVCGSSEIGGNQWAMRATPP